MPTTLAHPSLSDRPSFPSVELEPKGRSVRWRCLVISLSGPHRRSLSAIVACLCGLLLAGAVALVSPYVATAAAAGPAAPLALTSQAANPPALVALQQAELSAGDSAANDAFGSSVAISAGTALVGAPNKNGGAGVVYVFVRSGMTWSQQVELTDPDAVARDQFGCSVALCGDTALHRRPRRASRQPRCRRCRLRLHPQRNELVDQPN